MPTLLDSRTVTVANVTQITEPPSVPILQSPSNGATNVPIPTTLTWSVAQGAQIYRVVVMTDTTDVVIDSSVSQPTITISNLQVSTTYRWKVKAINQYGESDWSEVWEFTTSSQKSPDYTSLFSIMGLVMVMGIASSLVSREV